MTAARFSLLLFLLIGCGTEPYLATAPEGLSRQSREQADAKSTGCLSCHIMAKGKSGPGLFDAPSMHVAEARVGCTDCHGGNASAVRPPELPNRRPYDPEYLDLKNRAHILPRFPQEWPSSGNPVRSFTLLNKEDPAFIRFVNPGDLRVAHVACGSCHLREVEYVRRSLMTTSAMLWGGATYNNGSFPTKIYRFGESYSPDSIPQRLQLAIWRASDEGWGSSA